MKVLVTGANGFIGRHVCSELISRGWTVTGAVRDKETGSLLPSEVLTLLVEDMYSVQDWHKALQGITHVIHLIARTHTPDLERTDSYLDYKRVNVDLTENLTKACLSSGIKKFLFMSSIKAIGERSTSPLDENFPALPEDNYGKTKLEAEKLLIELCSKGEGMEYVIIRPPLVFGPEVRGNFQRLLKIASAGIPLPLGSSNNMRSVIFGKNLAHAVVHLLEKSDAGNNIFHISDEPDLSTTELLKKLRKGLGKPELLFPFPPPLLFLAAKLLGKGREAEKVLGSLQVSSEKARGSFGWTPPFTLEEGLGETCRWFKTKAD